MRRPGIPASYVLRFVDERLQLLSLKQELLGCRKLRHLCERLIVNGCVVALDLKRIVVALVKLVLSHLDKIETNLVWCFRHNVLLCVV